MVGRAAYAVHRGIVAPDRILLLAFNRNAAEELDQRVNACFERAGLDPTGIKAATFHSLGRTIVGDVADRMPDVAPWVEQGQDTEELLRIADQLKDSSDDFSYRWDLYRTLFGHAPTDIDTDEPDGWDQEQSVTGRRTFGGDIVRSHGERLIADFLFLNGVAYEYERPYDHSEATATRRHYRPDFYYPSIDTWHEHWALDRDGNPPASFRGYADDMEWKRNLHGACGTALIETTWANVVFGSGLAELKTELERRGIVLDWDPDRRSRDDWAKPLKDVDLANLIKTFMAHVRSNSSTRTDLEDRLVGDQSVLAGYRTELFLGLFWEVYEQWQARLAETGTIDFADMLATAADHLEAGRYEGEWDLVLVDEFQDASAVRARIVRALVAKPGRYLLAVGDDWQSINRFAGADISVMTGFADWFGTGPQLALTTTFRCTQQICDVARRFVSKNPRQFDKPMTASRPEPGPPVELVRSDDHASAVAGTLQQISAAVAAGTITPGNGDTVTVDVLGRYRFQRDVMPVRPPANLKVSFRTIHQSKGLEADCVIIPGLSTGPYGLPSNVRDDPVLSLAMPTAEPNPMLRSAGSSTWPSPVPATTSRSSPSPSRCRRSPSNCSTTQTSTCQAQMSSVSNPARAAVKERSPPGEAGTGSSSVARPSRSAGSPVRSEVTTQRAGAASRRQAPPMNVPPKLESFIAKRFPKTSATGEYMTVTATRAFWRIIAGTLAAIASIIGLLLLDDDWRGVIAGALLAWGASAAVWAYKSFGQGQAEIRDDLRRNAELDVLHARLNIIDKHLGLPLVSLDTEWEFIVRARMERLAHFSGLDEMRIFDDGIEPGTVGYNFWSAEAQGFD